MSAPLNYNVQITDGSGRPTPEFLRLWQQQSDLNNSIPVPSGNASQFYNGANPGVFAQVKDSDLSLSDVTTNNASLTAHGFLPKLTGATGNFLRADGTWAAPPGSGLPPPPPDATQFLNGAATPAFAKVKDSDLSISNVTTNNATTAQHGFLPALGGGTTNFLRADGTWAAPAGGGSSQSEFGMFNGFGIGTGWGSPNFFSGRYIAMPAAATIGSVKLLNASTVASGAAVTPALYTWDIVANSAGSLLASGPTVTSLTVGVNKFSLTTPYAAAKGQIIAFGLLSTGTAPASTVLAYTPHRFYFSATSIPSTAPAVTNTNTNWATWWLSTDT